VPTYATWNPAATAAEITLSNGNLTAELASRNVASTRATMGVTGGKWYWEITCGVADELAIGVAPSSLSTGDYPGFTADSWSYYSTTGASINSNNFVAYGAAYVDTNVVGVALNMDAGTITFYKNGISQTQAFSGLTGTLYPAVGMINGFASPGANITANFGATAFAYSVPAGYNAGMSIPDIGVRGLLGFWLGGVGSPAFVPATTTAHHGGDDRDDDIDPFDAKRRKRLARLKAEDDAIIRVVVTAVTRGILH
jgi:hypothetical protein